MARENHIREEKTMRKRLVRAVVITIVSALAVVLLAVLAGSESGHLDVSYRSLDYDATILANGDLKVVQHIDYKLDSRTNEDGDTQYWRQLYWQYTLDSTQLTNITDISVKNVTTGAVYHQINPQNPNSVDEATWDSKYADHWYIADVTDGSNNPGFFDPQTDGLDGSSANRITRNVEIGWNIPYTVKADSR